jgi:ribose 5-phosphate isomerase A
VRVDRDRLKLAAAKRAVEFVESGMVVGLGTGSTAAFVVESLAARVVGGLAVLAIPTSEHTAALARRLGIPLTSFAEHRRIDLAIDGADEVDRGLGLIKGGGSALLREKLVMAAARRVVIVAEATKFVERLGTIHPLPVEVVRFAWQSTRLRLLELVPSAVLRVAADGAPVVTDEGHYLIDCAVPNGDLAALGAAVKATLGVVEHGLFLGMADEVLLGRTDGSVHVLRR